jgi:hypothetical protein
MVHAVTGVLIMCPTGSQMAFMHARFYRRRVPGRWNSMPGVRVGLGFIHQHRSFGPVPCAVGMLRLGFYRVLSMLFRGCLIYLVIHTFMAGMGRIGNVSIRHISALFLVPMLMLTLSGCVSKVIMIFL